MKALPLFYYPTTQLWIDDDRILLSSMVEAFSGDNKILPFPSAKACLDYLKSYESPLSKYSFLKSNTSDENYGVLQRTPVDFDVTSLAALADNPKRHEEITVMVIDYHMPEMDGFALAEAIQPQCIQKVLLTGKAQERQAIEGFNSNLIQRFVQKGEDEMTDKLAVYLKELSLLYFQKKTQSLLSYLETENKLPLSDPKFVEFFNQYCEKHHIKEYYLIDKQGSFLCIDAQGHRSCLVMQSDSGIDSWLSVYDNEKALSQENLIMIKERQKIPFFGIGKEAWQIEPQKWYQHFYAPAMLEGRERYYWAKVD